jgi:general secretion pathway protein I
MIRSRVGFRRDVTAPFRTVRRGLTLIEVLVAMVVLVLAVVAISRLVDIGSDREADARLHIRAARLAQSKLAEVESGQTPLDAGQGQFDNDPSWSWSVASEPQGPPNLYLVTVTVSREMGGRKFQTVIAQMMMDPSTTGSASPASDPNTTIANGANP